MSDSYCTGGSISLRQWPFRGNVVIFKLGMGRIAFKDRKCWADFNSRNEQLAEWSSTNTGNDRSSAYNPTMALQREKSCDYVIDVLYVNVWQQ